MASTIFAYPIFSEIILPFILLFVLIFAVLQKTKVLGEGKKQIDSLVSLVIALITVSFSYATGVITRLMPFLAVSVVVILVFMILVGFISNDKKGFEMNKGLKISLGIVAGIAIVIAVLWATGALEFIIEGLVNGDSSGNIAANVIFVVVIGAVIAVALTSGKGSGSSGGDDE